MNLLFYICKKYYYTIILDFMCKIEKKNSDN